MVVEGEVDGDRDGLQMGNLGIGNWELGTGNWGSGVGLR